jgi:putative membrane protein
MGFIMSPKFAILTLAVSIALAGCASEQGTNGPNADYTNTNLPDNPQLAAVNDTNRALSHISDADLAFLRGAQAGGEYEVTAGQKALIKSSDPQVKSLAQQMVDDHTKANMQLNNLASRKGLPDTASMTADQLNLLSRLDSLSGTSFDREYLSQQAAAHQDAITKFENASINANDHDIRDWASATLPTLRDHLSMVQSRQQSLGFTTGANNTNTNTGGGM